MGIEKKITKVIYENSNDNSEGLRIKFEKIQLIKNEIATIADEHAIDFAEWLRNNCDPSKATKDWWYYNADLTPISELLAIYNNQKKLN